MKVNEVSETESERTPEALEFKDKVGYKLDELKIRVDTYQKYINTTLQVNAFYYAITGAVLGFYLGKANEELAYFLWLPILMGAVLGSIFIYAAHLQKRAAECIKRIVADLNGNAHLGIEEIPDIYLLHWLLLVFGIIFFIVGLGLTVVPNIGAHPSLADLIEFPDSLLAFAHGAYGMLFGSMIFTLLVIYRPHTKFIVAARKLWAGMNPSSNTKTSSEESESKAEEGTPDAP